MPHPVFRILTGQGVSADNRYEQENETGDLKPELVQNASEVSGSSSGTLKHRAINPRVAGLPGGDAS